MSLLLLFACSGEDAEVVDDAPVEVMESANPGHWKRLDAFAFGHVEYTATLLSDGSILLVGGYSDKAEVYDESRGRFRTVATMPDSRMGHDAVLQDDGTVLVVGGWVSIDGSPREAAASTLLYNPDADTWTAGPSLNLPRADHTVSRLGDEIWACGGGDGQRLIAPCEVLRGGSWTLDAELTTPRRGHTATVLGDALYLVGGEGDTGPIGVVDSIGGPTTTLQTARSHHHAFVHQDALWVVGGSDGDQVTGSVEVYDGDDWTEKASLHHPRAQMGGGSLSDGRVVIFGGTPIVESPDVLALREVEVYEDGAWLKGARLVKGRFKAPTLTVDAGLIFVGGESRGKAVMDITRYSPTEKPPREQTAEDLPSLGSEDALSAPPPPMPAPPLEPGEGN